MKRLHLLVFPMVAAACGGKSVNLQLHSNDAAPPAAFTTSSASRQALTVGTGDSDLTTVTRLKVTINEVDALFDNEKDGERDGSATKDDDKAWQVVTATPQQVDLAALRSVSTLGLGLKSTSSSELAEVRLKLKTDAADLNGDDRIVGAVVDSAGATCDLLVPHSAKDPGIKIEGLHHAGKLAASSSRVVLNLRVKDSSRDTSGSTCTYRLKPVIEIEKVEAEDSEADGGHEMPAADGGHP